MKSIKTLLAITALTTSSSIFAHGMMEGTFPKDGAMMMKPTMHVEVNFKNPMKLTNLKVVNSKGKPMAVDFKRSKDAATHFKAMTPDLSPGDYKVHWKAMGDDGHMMKGSFGFMQH